jgi:hypothetical protein
MLYADFLEDPVTWALLGIGCALAWRAAEATEPERVPADDGDGGSRRLRDRPAPAAA